jgi:DDE superfamily endonuclease
MDQTGVHLVPSARYTYAVRSSSSVEVIGAEDKRQITACVACAMDGTMLPLQLIFQGKTERCEPPPTVASLAALVDITHSENHWSSLETMQRWVEKVLMPYAERCVKRHVLRSDAEIILVLDVWSVHKSEAFRRYLRYQHPRIHLVFVPANCTSKLQVADVVLQRPFKAAITHAFNEWAAEQVRVQLRAGVAVGVANMLKMSNIKPLALEWCVTSWTSLWQRKQLVLDGWSACVLALFDVNDPEKRTEALVAVQNKELDHALVFDENEQDASDHDVSSDSDSDELDVSKARAIGPRKSTRESKPAAAFGYQISSQRIAMTEDSDN